MPQPAATEFVLTRTHTSFARNIVLLAFADIGCSNKRKNISMQV
jgi:hypothetical protein